MASSRHLYYYNVDHDLTDVAAGIDTAKTPLYVLTGEYDWSSTPPMGQALAAEVPGATFQAMPGLGHFPMCENPALFREYILPVLDEIRDRHADRGPGAPVPGSALSAPRVPKPHYS